MTLLRSIRRRPAPPAPEPMPPRPQLREPVPGADTRPRWGTGPDPSFDPCGNGPVQVRDGSDGKGGAPC